VQPRHAPVATDCDFHGRPLKEGDWLLLRFPAANRGPDVFPDADHVHLDRTENRHAAFGLGIDRCLGSNLARMESRVALQEWMTRYPDFERLWHGALPQNLLVGQERTRPITLTISRAASRPHSDAEPCQNRGTAPCAVE